MLLCMPSDAPRQRALLLAWHPSRSHLHCMGNRAFKHKLHLDSGPRSNRGRNAKVSVRRMHKEGQQRLIHRPRAPSPILRLAVSEEVEEGRGLLPGCEPPTHRGGVGCSAYPISWSLEAVIVTLYGTRCDSVSDLTLDYQRGSSVHHRDPCKREVEGCRADTREKAM